MLLSNPVTGRPWRWLLSVVLLLAAESQAALPWTLSGEQLNAEFWVQRTEAADTPLISADALAALNHRQMTNGPALRDLATLPATLPGDELRAQIALLSADPPATRVLASGQAPSKRQRRAWQRSLNLAGIGESVALTWALVTARADLRSLPTDTALFSTTGSSDLDRLQESALFPGVAVAIAHRSRDRQWAYVLSTRYAAWMRVGHLGITDRETALGFATRTPARWILDHDAFSSFDPLRQTRIRLDMGTRLLWLADWPLDQAVSGQLPLAHWVLEFPDRDALGKLLIRPILLPRSVASADTPLPFTRANLLRQGFRFLGERYGWGHDDEGRDCSGLISEIYASVGLLLPRNTGDQARGQALARIELTADTSSAQRLAAIRRLQAGDLLYMPGHVMMLVGQINGEPYVLHDAHTARIRDPAGELRELSFRGVVLTPLSPLLAEDGRSWIDLLTVLQRAEPRP